MGTKYYFNFNKYFAEEKKRLKDVEHLGIGPLERLKIYDGKEVIKLKERSKFYLKSANLICKTEWVNSEYHRGTYEN